MFIECFRSNKQLKGELYEKQFDGLNSAGIKISLFFILPETFH